MPKDFSHTDYKDFKDCYAALRLHIPALHHRVANSVAIFKIFIIRVKKIFGRIPVRILI